MRISPYIPCAYYTHCAEHRPEVILANYVHIVDDFEVVGLEQDSITVKFDAYVKTVPGVVHTLIVNLGRVKFVLGFTTVNGEQKPFTPSMTTVACMAQADVYCGLLQPKNLQFILQQNAPMFYARYQAHLDNFFEVTK